MREPLRVGLVGIGVGASQLLSALTTSPYGRLVAAADLRPEALQRLHAEYGIATFGSVQALCDHEIDAVWVATPNQLHAEHAIAALQRGKHVIVSKPMAISLAECQAMVNAAQTNQVHLLAGHSQCMASTIRRMADYTRSQELGRLGMLHTWHFTDWMYRPRLPEELDPNLGGGPVFRQASHQVDIVRAIAAQPVRGVRAMTVQLGAYTAYLEFQDGTPATIVYSGYGHFDLASWLRGGDGTSRQNQPRDKNALRYGAQAARGSNSLGLFGLTLASFEQADVRESTDGLEIHRRGETQHVHVPDEPRGSAELEELYQAVRHQKPLKHDGRWGQATLEVCLAINESARTRQEVLLASM
jgi:phthalate 4,5-cis-dihydrodiol dehydrogenase